jgi:hypothetical protein
MIYCAVMMRLISTHRRSGGLDPETGSLAMMYVAEVTISR